MRLLGAAEGAARLVLRRANPPALCGVQLSLHQSCRHPQSFAAIMRALLADMGGGQWRVREAASLAMADLLQVKQ